MTVLVEGLTHKQAMYIEQRCGDCMKLQQKQHNTCMMVLVASMGMRNILKDAAAAEATTVFTATFSPEVVS